MYALLIYSLKVGACLAVFYLFFKLLLSRETFHRLNRAVVLGALLLSFVLPLCVITVYREAPVLPEIRPALLAAAAEDAAGRAAEPAFPWERLAGGVFLLGAAAVLLRTLWSLGCVARLIRSGRRERQTDGVVLVRSDRVAAPFSWGRYRASGAGARRGRGGDPHTRTGASETAPFARPAGGGPRGMLAVVQSGDVAVAARNQGHP